MLIGPVLFKARNLTEKAPSIKRKRPKKASARDIGWAVHTWWKNGNCDVGNPGNGGRLAEPGAPASEGVADPAGTPAIFGNRNRAFPPRLRAGLRRSFGRDRRHYPRSLRAGLPHHHHRAGALGQAARPGVGG